MWTWGGQSGRLPRDTTLMPPDPFAAAVAETARRLASDVIRIVPTLGRDWSGEPAVFFLVILTDAARPDVATRVSQAITDELQPLPRWGLVPYFNFRSESEQSGFDEPVWA